MTSSMCIKIYVKIDPGKSVSSYHCLDEDSSKMCSNLPSNGELHILYALQNEYFKREVYFTLLSKLSENKELLDTANKDESSMFNLKANLFDTVGREMMLGYQRYGKLIIDTVVDSFLSKQK